MLDKVKLLSTAGGKIACLRCQAMSKRTRFQCGRPALKISKTQKCQFHGGASTGPRTEDGRRRIGDAHLVTGNYTKDAILESSHTLLVLRLLEDLMHVLKMTDVAKTRGPKPLNYRRINALDQVIEEIVMGGALK